MFISKINIFCLYIGKQIIIEKGIRIAGCVIRSVNDREASTHKSNISPTKIGHTIGCDALSVSLFYPASFACPHQFPFFFFSSEFFFFFLSTFQLKYCYIFIDALLSFNPANINQIKPTGHFRFQLLSLQNNQLFRL